MTRKICAMGETVLDILFKNDQPVAAVPGGSSFNSIISVGRTLTPCYFVGYTGNDHVGKQIMDFLQQNHVNTDYFEVRQGEKSTISLAFLDNNGNASYSFYKEPPHTTDTYLLPPMERNDVLLFGSYFAVSNAMQPLVRHMLTVAREAEAIVYYDVNFRPNHRADLPLIMPHLEENLRQSDIVRCSDEDVKVVFGTRDIENIYAQQIAPHCNIFICTAGAGEVRVFTPSSIHRFQVPRVEKVVSTIGAGDNFNAGFTYALLKERIGREQLTTLSGEQWDKLLTTACSFAAETCQTTDNYIRLDFAERIRKIN